MHPPKSSAITPGWTKSFLWLALAVVCFQTAYCAFIRFPVMGLLIFGYSFGLVKLANQSVCPARILFWSRDGIPMCRAATVFLLENF